VRGSRGRHGRPPCRYCCAVEFPNLLMLWKMGAACAVHGVLRRQHKLVAKLSVLLLSSRRPLDESAATGAGVSLLCGSRVMKKGAIVALRLARSLLLADLPVACSCHLRL
jgi:hypothetical protein